jgi:hypothetical protein
MDGQKSLELSRTRYGAGEGNRTQHLTYWLMKIPSGLENRNGLDHGLTCGP